MSTRPAPPPSPATPQLLSRVVAVINGKGGVGKTSTVANVAGLTALSGFHTLAIDLDPQGNLGLDLGYRRSPIDDEGRALASTVSFEAPLNISREVRPNLDVCVGGRNLQFASSGLVASPDRAYRRGALRRALEAVAGDYDLILIDCPPLDAALQEAALAAARWALIPLKTDAASVEGMEEINTRVESVLDLNPDLDLLGVLLFGIGRSASRVQTVTRDAVATVLGDRTSLFTTTIRHVEASAQEARRRGLLVHELEQEVASAPAWYEQLRSGAPAGDRAPTVRSAGGLADDYQQLTEEIVTRITSSEGVAPDGTQDPSDEDVIDSE